MVAREIIIAGEEPRGGVVALGSLVFLQRVLPGTTGTSTLPRRLTEGGVLMGGWAFKMAEIR
jgi:hypothetical protein